VQFSSEVLQHPIFLNDNSDFAPDSLYLGPQFLLGDSRLVLSDLPAEVFQTCVTSPPYWGLRNYDSDLQIGLELQPEKYAEDIVKVFSGVKRVLREDGVLWLNIGDTYTSGNRKYRDTDKKLPQRGMGFRAPTPKGWKNKELIGIPWLIAQALQRDGWFLRADIIWYKPNCMPESVKDRVTRSHEYVFMFTKSERYFYDSQTAREENGRNWRTLWAINTEPCSVAHFATFPKELVKRCLTATSRPGDWILDPFSGSGTTGIVSDMLGRKSLGIELNEEYKTVIQDRFRIEGLRRRPESQPRTKSLEKSRSLNSGFNFPGGDLNPS
jgi:DNA modification methylase